MGVDMAVVIVLGSLVYLTVAGARLIWSPTTFSWPEVPVLAHDRRRVYDCRCCI